jgi:signal transduction histidine kinase
MSEKDKAKLGRIRGYAYHLPCTLLLVAVVGVADYLTGWELSFSLFYLIPIGMAAWFQGRQNTVIVVGICTLAWMTVDIVSDHAYSKHAILYWNTFVRLGIFGITGLTLVYIREMQIRNRDLINYIVHDLRSPLFVVMGNLEFLREMPAIMTDPQIKECVKDCQVAGGRMTTLINSILDLSRLESSKIPMNRQAVPVRDLIDAPLREVSVFAKHCGVTLSSVIAEGIDYVYADHTLTLRILVNLLSNAIKAAPAQTTVTLQVEPNDQQKVVFSVTDQGHGIPKKYLQVIFDKFVQLEMRRTRVLTGSGLGLAFCQLAIKAQGEQIWVESGVISDVNSRHENSHAAI